MIRSGAAARNRELSRAEPFRDARTLQLERGLDHGDADFLAFAGTLPIEQRCKRRLNRHCGGRKVKKTREAKGVERFTGRSTNVR